MFCFGIFFGHTRWLEVSQFPKQGLNLHHGSESPDILTMRPPGNSQTWTLDKAFLVSSTHVSVF